MIAWPMPALPALPPAGPLGPLMLSDTGTSRRVAIGREGEPARLYVCGITPYDATHLGHAFTYVAFDLVGRTLRDCGAVVRYCQNITDIDDPLLERAAALGIDWRDLADTEIALFREDMTALGVIPPQDYVGAVESIPLVVTTVEGLVGRGAAYPVPAADAADPAGQDWYLDLAATPGFGEVCQLDRAAMRDLFARRGGDPDRPGKRDALDPLLWRAARDGEPSWPGGILGPGRPGWHVECTAIVHAYLGDHIDLQGGGADLIFPHHEMCAVTSAATLGERPFALAYAHTGMVGLGGAKMSKSRGNLVLVSALRERGVDAMAIRLMLIGRHYRSDWDFTEALLGEAEQRLATWRAALAVAAGPSPTATVAAIRQALRDDLDSPAAVAAVDRWVQLALERPPSEPAVDGAAGPLARALDALLGIRL